MLDTENILPKLKRLRARRVFIQVPEGLKTRVQELSRELEGAGLKTFISIEPCFGACDIRDREARALGCDALLHAGHSDYGLKTVLPVIYEECRIDFDPAPLLKMHLGDLRSFKKICLVTTVQYLSSLARAATFLREHGKKILLGSPIKARHPGQLLGCDFSAAKSVEPGADCFLFMGTGTFHPLGLSLEVEKPVLFLDFESTELIDLGQERFSLQKMRYARIAKASDARDFVIFVSTKPGQAHPDLAMHAKEKLESLGRRAWIVVADQLTPSKLMGLKAEAIINTACPRIQEDAKLFRKPIISVGDIDMFEEMG